jgi:hypothetical protein
MGLREKTGGNVGSQVECYAGYRGEETPRVFYLGDRRIKVAAVLDRRHEPDHRYFKVRGDDGGHYILGHDVEKDRWEITLEKEK